MPNSNRSFTEILLLCMCFDVRMCQMYKYKMREILSISLFQSLNRTGKQHNRLLIETRHRELLFKFQQRSMISSD